MAMLDMKPTVQTSPSPSPSPRSSVHSSPRDSLPGNDHTQYSGSKRRRVKRCTSPSDFAAVSQQELESYGETFSNNLPAKQRMDSLLTSVASLYGHPSTLAHQAQNNSSFNIVDTHAEAKHYSTLDMLLSPIRQKSVLDSWSGKDIALFESGICKYGKRFGEIRRELMPHKQTGELVRFYYDYFKKSVHSLAWKRGDEAHMVNVNEGRQLRTSTSMQTINYAIGNSPPEELELKGKTRLGPVPDELRDKVLAAALPQQQLFGADLGNGDSLDATAPTSQPQAFTSPSLGPNGANGNFRNANDKQPPKAWTAEQEQRIRELRLSGMDVASVAAAVDRSQSSVANKLFKMTTKDAVFKSQLAAVILQEQESQRQQAASAAASFNAAKL